jgi:hypothetical protein
MAFSKEHFQQHKFSYEAAGLFGYFAINATINATTELMEEARGSEASFHTWEPFVWEYSSALATLFIIPLIAWFMHKYPWDWQASKEFYQATHNKTLSRTQIFNIDSQRSNGLD